MTTYPTPKIRTVPVTLNLPVETYLVVEGKATALGISAPRLLTAFVNKCVVPSGPGDPEIIIEIASAENTRETRKPMNRPTGYEMLPPEDQVEFRRLAEQRTSAEKLGRRFGVHAKTALAWRNTLVEAGTITIEAQSADAPRRGYVRLNTEQIVELTKLIDDGATDNALIERFGFSAGSVRNWRRRVAASRLPIELDFEATPEVTPSAPAL